MVVGDGHCKLASGWGATPEQGLTLLHVLCHLYTWVYLAVPNVQASKLFENSLADDLACLPYCASSKHINRFPCPSRRLTSSLLTRSLAHSLRVPLIGPAKKVSRDQLNGFGGNVDYEAGWAGWAGWAGESLLRGYEGDLFWKGCSWSEECEMDLLPKEVTFSEKCYCRL